MLGFTQPYSFPLCLGRGIAPSSISNGSKRGVQFGQLTSAPNLPGRFSQGLVSHQVISRRDPQFGHRLPCLLTAVKTAPAIYATPRFAATIRSAICGTTLLPIIRTCWALVTGVPSS